MCMLMNCQFSKSKKFLDQITSYSINFSKIFFLLWSELFFSPPPPPKKRGGGERRSKYVKVKSFGVELTALECRTAIRHHCW